MPLSERAAIDKIEIMENGLIFIRRARVILDNDGVTELNRLYQRESLEPGQDVSNQPNKIKQICQLIWTQQVVDAYRIAKQSRILPTP